MADVVNIADWKRGSRSETLLSQYAYRGFCITAMAERDYRARIILRHDRWTEVTVYLREFDFNRMMLLACALADQIIANGGVMPLNMNRNEADVMHDGA